MLAFFDLCSVALNAEVAGRTTRKERLPYELSPHAVVNIQALGLSLEFVIILDIYYFTVQDTRRILIKDINSVHLEAITVQQLWKFIDRGFCNSRLGKMHVEEEKRTLL